VCEVRYVELTREGTLRHPSYRGLRAGHRPARCTGEERRESTKNALREAAAAAQSGNGAAAKAKVARVPALLHDRRALASGSRISRR
jgi:hypothetical protein